MKHSFRILTLLAAVLMLAGCEKPDNPAGGNGNGGNGNNEPKDRTIIYAVGDNENRQTLTTDSEWDALLDQFCLYAEAGDTVTFYNYNIASQHPSTPRTKEAPTIITNNREELKRWMMAMEKEGRTVRVTYNDSDGTWSGQAYATAPTESTAGEIVGTWHFNCMVVTRFDLDGDLLGSDLYVPEDGGGTMYYTFSDDGTVTLTMHGMDGTTATDSSTWSLSADGVLYSDLLPSGDANWNVNWISANTMIISSANLGTMEGDLLYQLQFDRE